jgi:TM2 domain-containing membrane protein YozV
MWFYPLLLLFGLLAIVGIVIGGGIFTLIFIPLGVIGLVSAVGYVMWGRAQAAAGDGATGATHTAQRPLPGRGRRQRGREATRPERLVDARRESARSPEQ